MQSIAGLVVVPAIIYYVAASSDVRGFICTQRLYSHLNCDSFQLKYKWTSRRKGESLTA